MMMPQDFDAERAVIACVFVENSLYPTITAAGVTAEVFYMEQHRAIWRAVSDLYSSKTPIDIFTVGDWLESKTDEQTIADRRVLMEYVSSLATIANVETHARIVYSKYRHRQAIITAQEMINLTADTAKEPEQIIEEIAEKAQQLSKNCLPSKSLKPIYDYVIDELQRMDMARKDRELLGVRTGIARLDIKLNGGLKGGEFHILAARPGMGKTALVMNILSNIAKSGKRVLFLPTEMTGMALARRAISIQSGLDHRRLSMATVNDEEIDAVVAAANNIMQQQVMIEEDGCISIPAFRTLLHRVCNSDQRPDIVIIDRICQMEPVENHNGNRTGEMREISKGLLGAARDFKMPILGVTQLSRATEGRSDKRPILSDLRDSGSLEQDAHSVMLLYRPDYYESDDLQHTGQAELIVAKNRDGETGSVMLHFDAATMRMVPIDRRCEG